MSGAPPLRLWRGCFGRRRRRPSTALRAPAQGCDAVGKDAHKAVAHAAGARTNGTPGGGDGRPASDLPSPPPPRAAVRAGTICPGKRVQRGRQLRRRCRQSLTPPPPSRDRLTRAAVLLGRDLMSGTPRAPVGRNGAPAMVPMTSKSSAHGGHAGPFSRDTPTACFDGGETGRTRPPVPSLAPWARRPGGRRGRVSIGCHRPGASSMPCDRPSAQSS